MDVLISPKQQMLRLIDCMSDYPEELGERDYGRLMEQMQLPSPRKNHTLYSTYKPSVFNYIHQDTKRVIVFNTLYGSLVRLSLGEYERYRIPGEIRDETEKELAENGLWVRSQCEELRSYLSFCHGYTKYAPPVP